ncbi:MAG: hypothetical protein KBG15_06485 [Kofleriaceae bacterium]|nr:hypothetical protein [Kofleriaceae bacterium]
MAITPFRFTLLPLLFAGSAATLLACGDEPSNQFADAPRVDAAIDAARPDAPTSGVVEVTIATDAGPVAGATVVFQNADDSVVATATTDAAGVASQLMNVGGSVTAIVVDSARLPTARGGINTHTYTVLAVKPGDKLKIHANDNGTNPVSNAVSVLLPVNSFGSYEVVSSCGTEISGVTPDKGGALTIFVPPSCTQATLLVKREATSGTGGTAAASIFKANVTLTAGSFDLSDQTFTGLVVHNITGTNMPALVGLSGYVAPVLTGFLGKIAESQPTIMPPGFPTFAGTFERANTTATKQIVAMNVQGDVGMQQFVALGNVGDVTIDGATALAPWITAAQFTQANSSFAFTTAAAGNAPINGAFVELGIGRQTGFINRHVIGPSAAALRLPILPTAQAEFNVLGADSTFIGVAGIISSPGGYDVLRPAFFNLSGPEAFFILAPNVNGQLCASIFFGNG